LQEIIRLALQLQAWGHQEGVQKLQAAVLV
jgi:hypothetical protein